MLSIEQCREALGVHATELSDHDIALIRQQMYCLASLAVEVARINPRRTNP